MSNDLDGRRMSRVITPNMSDYNKKYIHALITAIFKFFLVKFLQSISDFMNKY